MTTFKAYLAYRLKRTGITTLIFSLLSVIFTIFTVSVSTKSFAIPYNGETGIYILAIILGVFSTLIPMLETADFKNRRNLDTLYFLPMNRFKLALAHYISGFIQVAVIYTVSFAAAGLYLINYSHHFRLEYLPLYYGLSLIIGLVMYSFVMFIFGQANTVADGVIFCVLWSFVLYYSLGFFSETIGEYFNIFWTDAHNVVYNIPIISELYGIYCDISECYEWGIVYMPINNLTMIFQYIIEVREEYFVRSVEKLISQSYMFWVWLGIGIASAYGYFKTFLTKKTEKAGEVSDSVFGYVSLIPFFGFGLLLGTSYGNVFCIIVFAMMVSGYLIYHRGAKFKKSDIILLAVALVLPLFGTILNAITGTSLEHSEVLAIILFFGTPIASGVSSGMNIYLLLKNIKERKEGKKRKLNKNILGIIISSAVLIISVVAMTVSSVLAILN
ncbi:MAG: hypothetical protein IJW76_07165 [Clostridia bacterium]|nr:hypothetical protein [Clostridia bacterium]